MTHRLPRSSIVMSIILLVAVAVSTTGAQTPTNTIPRTPDGKPDLSGIWQVMNTAAWDIQDHTAQKGVPAGVGVVVGRLACNSGHRRLFLLDM